MRIITGKQAGALKTVIYGPEGIGKSTLAARFPKPLFIDTEGSTRHMDVARMEKPSSWTMLLEQVRYIRNTPGVCETLAIDTADWAEQLCIRSICASKEIGGIEDMGYGKGYVYLAEEFGKLLNLLEEVVERGCHVVLTAHAMMRKFEQPDEMGAYDRWELKLQKKTASLVKEWSDLLLFANYKTIAVATDEKGKKFKAQGGRRVLYTAHHPCWDAKNRLDLPRSCPWTLTPSRPTSSRLPPHSRSPRPRLTPIRRLRRHRAAIPAHHRRIVPGLPVRQGREVSWMYSMPPRGLSLGQPPQKRPILPVRQDPDPTPASPPPSCPCWRAPTSPRTRCGR